MAGSASAPRDVLFYGDSLTWGMGHNFTGRYPQTFPQMLEARLRAKGLVMHESALCSRTSKFDDQGNTQWLAGGEPHFFNGAQHFLPEFLSRSCRCLVLLLGTNDLKTHIRAMAKARTRVDAYTIASNCAQLAEMAIKAHDATPRLRNHPLTIVLVSPPPVRLNQLSRALGYDETSVKISYDFPEAFRQVCQEHKFEFCHVPGINMNESVDGVHITTQATKTVADAVWKVLVRALDLSDDSSSGDGGGEDIDEDDDELDDGARDDDSDSYEHGRGKRKRKPSTAQREAAAGNAGASRSSKNGGNKHSARALSSSSSRRANQRTGSGNRRTSRKSNRDRNRSRRNNQRNGGGEDNGLDLIWVQCTKCRKWRLAYAYDDALKGDWTCNDEFWSNQLDEWKVGCGWKADQMEDEIRSDSDSESLVKVGDGMYLVPGAQNLFIQAYDQAPAHCLTGAPPPPPPLPLPPPPPLQPAMAQPPVAFGSGYGRSPFHPPPVQTLPPMPPMPMMHSALVWQSHSLPPPQPQPSMSLPPPLPQSLPGPGMVVAPHPVHVEPPLPRLSAPSVAQPATVVPGIDASLQSPSLTYLVVPFIDHALDSLSAAHQLIVLEKRNKLINGSLPEQLVAIMHIKGVLVLYPSGAEFDRLVQSWPLWGQFAPLLHHHLSVMAQQQQAAQAGAAAAAAATTTTTATSAQQPPPPPQQQQLSSAPMSAFSPVITSSYGTDPTLSAASQPQPPPQQPQ